jgi:hypothetical protein
METFPTLSRDVEWSITEEYEDSAISSTAEAGYVHSRARYTYDRRSWSISYIHLNTADRTLIRALIVAGRVTVLTFNWVNPDDTTNYIVRFASPPKWEREAPGYYSLGCTFKQL